MSELKTLKDLVELFGPEKRMYGGRDFLSANIIKQEAIKWIKALEQSKEKVKKAYSRPEGIIAGKNYEIGWIKHFFNIESEDLK